MFDGLKYIKKGPTSSPQGEEMSLKTASDDEHDFVSLLFFICGLACLSSFYEKLSTKEEPYEPETLGAGPSTMPEPELRLRSRKRSAS